MSMNVNESVDYGSAILAGFEYLLENHQEVFVMGQGLWSPWYVGNSMTNLDKKFGKHRVIDTPVSESAVTGIGFGASLAGMKSIIVHPRIDFMLYAMDPIVNQAAKWSSMFGGQASVPSVVRGIINRGGEQGAQHSQALHSWFAHIPGLRVVMPSTVADARDLLIAATLCPDPVIYIDDRWLYEQEDILEPVVEMSLSELAPKIRHYGKDITIVGSGYSYFLAAQAIGPLSKLNYSADVIDLRIINPLDVSVICDSVAKTGRLLVIDGGWENCGLAGEVIAGISEKIPLRYWKSPPARLTLPASPAPTAKVLENSYYPTVEDVVQKALKCLTK